MGRLAHLAAIAGLGAVVFSLYACGDDETGANTGNKCQTVSDCYPNVPPNDIQGTVVCIDKVPGGYCSHSCTQDSDCCATDAECPNHKTEVCAPLENSSETNCFLSCEDSDLDGRDPDDYCHTFANPNFGCRSTGGGSANRKVCLP